MHNVLKALHSIGFLKKTRENGEDIFHLTTPCRFKIDESVVGSLKANYLTDQEIGGVLWAKPNFAGSERSYIISKVSYIRNAIEDIPRIDHFNKSNAYLPDKIELNTEIEQVILRGILPIKFHSHPIKGSGFIETLLNPNFTTETSDKDIFESSFLYSFGNEKLLMPRCLIVGNDLSCRDIFIGIYNGFVAPESFFESKKKVQEENLRKISDHISTINLTDGAKEGLAVGAVLLLYAIAKYPKYSLPVVLGLTAMIPQLLTNTQYLSDPHYFNKLSSGCADIFIPETSYS